MDGQFVTIPIARYEELVRIEERVSIAAATACRNRCVPVEELMWILGTELSVEIASEMMAARNRKIWKCFKEDLE